MINSVFIPSLHREFGLGRFHKPDERDKEHLVLRRAQPSTRPKQFSRSVRWIGDQGVTPQCVGYSSAGFLRCAPERHLHWKPETLYSAAQERDQWPGTDYEGTTVRAAFAYLKERGEIEEYMWFDRVYNMCDWIYTFGPIVVGTDWYVDMFTPLVGAKDNGLVRPTGENVGGHAYLCYGYDDQTRLLKFANSWGKNWGPKGGRFTMFYEDFGMLLGQQGEACAAKKLNLKRHKVE